MPAKFALQHRKRILAFDSAVEFFPLGLSSFQNSFSHPPHNATDSVFPVFFPTTERSNERNVFPDKPPLGGGF